MKTQKIFLLVLVLLLALGLASCGDTEESKAPECFVFDGQASFDDVAELEGKVVEFNLEYNLVALENIEFDDDGRRIRTVKVVDVTDPERTIYSETESFSSDSTSIEKTYHLDNYPVIEVRSYNSTTDSDGNPKTVYYSSFYLIDDVSSSMSLATGVHQDDADIEVAEINNIYLVALEDKVYWIGKDLDVMRTVSRDVSDSYIGLGSSDYTIEEYFAFDAEYEDYLYTYNFDPEKAITTIIVYGPDGIASAQYNYSAGTAYVDADSIINPKMYVLNNGDVLIQECIMVEDGEEYDFVYGTMAQKLLLNTKIMNCMTGEVIDVDFDYLIKDFESAYAREDDEDFFFGISSNYDNQAYLVSIADGALGRATEYAVLSNSLERQYTLNNKHMANYDTYNCIYDADKAGYIAEAYVNGKYGIYKFDWSGNAILALPKSFIGIVDDCYVTTSGVYRMDDEKTCVFDIDAFGASGVKVDGGAVYVYKITDKYNVRDDDGEIIGTDYDTLTYKIDLATGKENLIADSGEDQDVETLTRDGAYYVEDDKKDIVSYYNKEGTLVLVIAYDDIVLDESFDDAEVITVLVGGEYKTYVLGFGDMKEAKK